MTALPACTCFVGDGLPRQHANGCARVIALTEPTAEQRLMDRLHAEALAENTARQPYCTGDRCTDCTAPTVDDPDDECCEATCGCCPRVDEHGNCWLSPERDDGSRYCSQHGEGWLNDRTPEAERRYRILRDA